MYLEQHLPVISRNKWIWRFMAVNIHLFYLKVYTAIKAGKSQVIVLGVVSIESHDASLFSV